MYNKRLPRPEETYLHIGNGHKLKVEWFGSLDVVLHCKEDVPVTLEDVAVVPSLAFDLRKSRSGFNLNVPQSSLPPW